MMWPWRRRAAEAERGLAEAEERKRGVDELVQQSRRVNTRLRQEIEKNGFTELMQAAMRRAPGEG